MGSNPTGASRIMSERKHPYFSAPVPGAKEGCEPLDALIDKSKGVRTALKKSHQSLDRAAIGRLVRRNINAARRGKT